jgi:hypothetical protein
MTDEEIQHVTELHGSTERPRRIALCNEGKVIDSGKKRLTASNRWATIWEAVSGSDLMAEDFEYTNPDDHERS